MGDGLVIITHEFADEIGILAKEIFGIDLYHLTVASVDQGCVKDARALNGIRRRATQSPQRLIAE